MHQNLLAFGVALAGEEDGLHVFAADFADKADGGMEFLDSGGDGDDFLNKFRADERSNQAAAGAGEENAVLLGSEAELLFEAEKKLENFLGLLGVVALVSLGEDFAGALG